MGVWMETGGVLMALIHHQSPYTAPIWRHHMPLKTQSLLNLIRISYQDYIVPTSNHETPQQPASWLSRSTSWLVSSACRKRSFGSYFLALIIWCISFVAALQLKALSAQEEPRYVAGYQVCHVTYRLNIPSKNLLLADQSKSWILNVALWFAGQHQVLGTNVWYVLKFGP
jgi:hypothetical protein